MDKDDLVLLQRHEAAAAAALVNGRIAELACRCSWNPTDFRRPYSGLRIAFGKTEAAQPKYIIEFMPRDRDWWITLIASRDSELPTGEGETKVRHSAFKGDNPRCPDSYSPRQRLLWQQLFIHFITPQKQRR